MSDSSQPPIHHRFLNLLRVSDADNVVDRWLLPILILLAMAFTGWQMLNGAWLLVLVSLAGIALMVTLATVQPIRRMILQRDFTRHHAFYVAIIWVCALLTVYVARQLIALPATGKESQLFYVFLVLMIAIVFRLLLAIYALFPAGYQLFMSRIPLWEQVLVAINEFVAAGLMALILGGELARALQPDVLTLRFDFWYSLGLMVAVITYYGLVQMMWVQRWNQWLSQRTVWLPIARVLFPFALVMATAIIIRHFTRLSDPRSANLLGTASIDQTILALSPIIWMMFFFGVLVVYTGNEGLRRLLLPDRLLKLLPERTYRALRTVSDMDVLMIIGAIASVIPLQVFVFNNDQIIGNLQEQVASQTSLIDTSAQALALIFGLPFYVLAVVLLIAYASMMINRQVSATVRDGLVADLPFTLLIMFIITLYLAAIPFSQVLTTGRLPRLPQDLGYILAFNVLIPLLLFVVHFVVLIRVPYGIGQSAWRKRYEAELTQKLRASQRDLSSLQRRIQQAERIWRNRDNLDLADAERLEMLYELIELNGQRDSLNMERTRLLSEQQQLQQISDEPVSLAIANLPRQVVTYGITLVLFFKIYEWAIVNDGLREVANNPNIGVLEFFQTILEATNF